MTRADRIRALADLAPGWDSYRGRPTTRHAIEVALRLDPVLPACLHPVPHAGGGLSFEGLGTEIEIDADGYCELAEWLLSLPVREQP